MTRDDALNLQGTWNCKNELSVTIVVVANRIVFHGSYENESGKSHLEVYGFAEIDGIKGNNRLSIKWGDTANSTRNISGEQARLFLQTTIVEYDAKKDSFEKLYSTFPYGSFGEFTR